MPQIAIHLAEGGVGGESYHSLEDKTVKTFMNQGLKTDVPADMPVIPPDMCRSSRSLREAPSKPATRKSP